MAAAVYEGWEYPPPDCYSCDHRDSEGHLRMKGALLKKGGSKHMRRTDRNSGDRTPTRFFGRRNWSDRSFFLDMESCTWSYYKDDAYENLAGVVCLLATSSIVVPEEVRLRGRHAPSDPTETLNYFEVHNTTDAQGAPRDSFVVRAPSPREFEDWLRALRWALAKLRRGSTSTAPVRPAANFYTGQPKPTANYKDELEDALENVNLSGASERKSEARSSAASAELRLGFDAEAFLDMEYYYQDMNGAQKGPVDFDGLKCVWARTELDELSYVYTNRKDEWVDLASLPTLVRLLVAKKSLSPPPPPPPPPPPVQARAGVPYASPTARGLAPRAFRL